MGYAKRQKIMGLKRAQFDTPVYNVIRLSLNVDFRNHFMTCAILRIWNKYKPRICPKVSASLKDTYSVP